MEQDKNPIHSIKYGNKEEKSSHLNDLESLPSNLDEEVIGITQEDALEALLQDSCSSAKVDREGLVKSGQFQDQKNAAKIFLLLRMSTCFYAPFSWASHCQWRCMFLVWTKYWCENVLLGRPLLLVFFPISYPIGKLLDWLLGMRHSVLVRQAGLKTLVDLHAHEVASDDPVH
ncbi:hypothetical protein FEM48_Zijuj03G0163900 [Ziziphus jujuba var. spinosa]|uniref:Uncharacterized protein n=1 Tax=Ziziphus jujuba var. spinosa TaxID=714518 RepID=A0A978VRD0_ZIZJJ|nr:hypothetical protein FEM48_Zijuj03G0163900 [Ziziphus jujuba var. spinosa]